MLFRKRRYRADTFLTDRFPAYQKLIDDDERRYRRSVWVRRALMIAALAFGIYVAGGF